MVYIVEVVFVVVVFVCYYNYCCQCYCNNNILRNLQNAKDKVNNTNNKHQQQLQ